MQRLGVLREREPGIPQEVEGVLSQERAYGRSP